MKNNLQIQGAAVYSDKGAFLNALSPNRSELVNDDHTPTKRGCEVLAELLISNQEAEAAARAMSTVENAPNVIINSAAVYLGKGAC